MDIKMNFLVYKRCVIMWLFHSKIQFSRLWFILCICRREREFKVSIKFASKADLHHLSEFLKGRQHDVPQETLQFLDVVLRESPSKRFISYTHSHFLWKLCTHHIIILYFNFSYEVVGRSFFAPQLGGSGELGNGLEYWKGFYQSLRPTQMGLSLNIGINWFVYNLFALLMYFNFCWCLMQLLNMPPWFMCYLSSGLNFTLQACKLSRMLKFFIYNFQWSCCRHVS